MERSNLPLLQSSLIAGMLFIASLTFYIATLAPSVVTLFDDSLEFQLVTYRLGIAHPTGYPLYTLLGKLFTFVPAGNIAYRVNLMSAFFGAATVALLYLLIVRMAAKRLEDWKIERLEDWTRLLNVPTFQHSNVLTFHPSNLPSLQPSWPIHLGGVIGALLFAVGPVFWQQATIAEVYSFNAFFVVMLLLVAVTILPGDGIFTNQQHTPSNDPVFQRSAVGGQRSVYEGAPRKEVLWLAFLFGLSLTHHRTMVLLLPALVLFLYLTQKPSFLKTPGFYRTLLLSLLLGLIPLLLYLYLPLRGHIGSLDGTYENTWAGFWRQISAGGYGVFIFGNPFDQERDFSFYWNLFQSQFYTLIPGFIGLFYLLWRGQRRLFFLTGTAFLTYLVFNLFYKVSDIEVFFIPPFLIWAAWSGVGVAWVLQFTATRDRGPETGDRPVIDLSHLGVAGLILAVFAFILFQLFQAGLPILQARNTWQVHDYGLDMLQQPLPERSAVVGILGEMTLLRYFQETENRRPDIETIAADLEADRLAAIEKLLAQGKTVYLTREAAMLPGTTVRWSLNAVGPLTRIDPEPVITRSPFMVAVNQPVIPEITLLGYDLSHPPHTSEGLPPLRLTLFWQITAPITRSLQVSARLINPAGETKAVIDTIPVHRAYSTTAWRPGEIISDVYDLILPVDTLPDSYTPLVIWYDSNQNGELGRIELKPVAVE